MFGRTFICSGILSRQDLPAGCEECESEAKEGGWNVWECVGTHWTSDR